jgi:hypothetical protein
MSTGDATAVPHARTRVTLANGLAWLCLLVALLFPLGILLNGAVLLARVGLGYPLVFLYNALDYFGLPVVLLAIVLGHLSQLAAIRLPSPPVKRHLARTGLWIGYLSVVFIFVAFGVVLEVSR